MRAMRIVGTAIVRRLREEVWGGRFFFGVDQLIFSRTALFSRLLLEAVLSTGGARVSLFLHSAGQVTWAGLVDWASISSWPIKLGYQIWIFLAWAYFSVLDGVLLSMSMMTTVLVLYGCLQAEM